MRAWEVYRTQSGRRREFRREVNLAGEGRREGKGEKEGGSHVGGG